MSLPLRLAVLAASLNFAVGAAAAMPTEDVVANAVDRALADAYSRDPAPEAGALRIERPEQQRFELGAVLDVRAASPEGVAVLAITPGGAAERIGLKAGDRVLAINGTAVAGSDVDPASALLEALAGSDGALAIDLRRGQDALSLKGAADLVRIPAYVLEVQPPVAQRAEGCGYVSGGAKAYGQVRKVRILAVDGQSAPASLVGRLRLPAGKHTLTLQMLPKLGFLEARGQLPASPMLPRPTPDMRVRQPERGMPPDGSGARQSGIGPALTLQLEVAADQSYQLGARPDGQGGVEAFIAAQSPRSCRE